MDFWNNKVNVSKEAAELQVEIIKQLSPEKRFSIALEFANLSVNRTRAWIKKENPNFSELEVSLEWVKLMYYERGEMSQATWEFYKNGMEEKIKKDRPIDLKK